MPYRPRNLRATAVAAADTQRQSAIWNGIMIGAVVTAFLFTVGKFLIGLYLGSSSIASSYGAAGSLIIVLLWIYYSAQIFLLGAEFTKVYAAHRGSHQSGRRHLLRLRSRTTRAEFNR